MKILLVLGVIASLLMAGRAHATCPNPLTIKDASGATQNLATTTDASGSCIITVTLTNYRLAGGTSGSSDNAHFIKAGPGTLYHFTLTYDGTGAAVPNYLKFYNQTTAPTSCTATNIGPTYAINLQNNVAGIDIAIPQGLPFSTGIAYCIVSGSAADNADGNGSAGGLLNVLYN